MLLKSKMPQVAIGILLTISCVFPHYGFTQQTKRGKISGFILNQANSSPLIKATIEIIGKGITAQTGIEGDYTLEVEPGTYDLKISREGFVGSTLEGVVVTAGETTPIDGVLQAVGAGEQITVTAGNSNDVADIIQERKSNSMVSEVISAREISKDTSSNAAGVLQRVTGVSLVERFVFVRGLGERYSNTSLNDALLPTTEPDRKVVPMDLIPANLLQNVKILKTFTPDQPGEFSGGLVRLETIDFPKAASLSIKFTSGFNTRTHDRDFLSYPGTGGARNFFGFGRGARSLPSTIPANERVFRGNDFIPGGFTPEQLETIGESFNNIFTPTTSDARPTFGWSASGGATFGRFGFVSAFSFKNEPQTLSEIRNYYVLGEGGRIVPNANYDYDSSEFVARLGMTVNASYELTKNNKLFFKNFLTNQATDEARIFEGFYLDRGSVIRNQRLRYIEERIYTGQVSGNHLVNWLGDSVFTWRYTYSRATLDEPDLRESLYEFSETQNDFIYFAQTQSLFHLFNKMRENVREPAFDLAKYFFFGSASLNTKLGASYINRDRSFDSRRFRFLPRGNILTTLNTSLPPEQLLTPENIKGTNGFEIREETRTTDHYDALHNIYAGYLMADYTLKNWRFIGGARVEKSEQRVNTFEPYRPEVVPIAADLDNTDVLPSAGLVYTFRNGTMNLRGGFSRTVARPQFRELSPFEFTDVTGGRSAVGNPDVKRTLISNFDGRYEWYFGATELLAIGVFHKQLDDPIEVVVEATTSLRTSFRNAEKARNTGVEIELRKNLGNWWERLKHFSVNTNYTYVKSRVDIGAENVGILTSANRPLIGQAKNIVNFVLDHEIPKWGIESRALFNYTGERITEVGAFGLPDTIQKGYPNFDLSFTKGFGVERRWRVEFQIENLLDRQHNYRVGSELFRTYRNGRSFEFGIAYKIF
ncbi:MAG: outer membrane beta-barrel protein [Acidobacteriota bacterium]